MISRNEVAERPQYLSFVLGGGDYAVGILKVKEILQYEDITAVPSTPRSIRGVINLRGRVVPVVDLAIRCGMPETPTTRRTCILVVETALGGAPTVMGLMADSVSEVIDLGPGDVEPPPAFGAGVQVDYLVGMGKVGRKFVLLLDIDRMLSADERELALAVRRGELEAAAAV
jgi:purine-binding chemotaxis protein CheW